MFTISILKKNTMLWFLPCIIMLGLMLGHYLFKTNAGYLIHAFHLNQNIRVIEHMLYFVLMGFSQYWLFTRIIEKATGYIKKVVFFQQFPSIRMIIPFFTAILKTITFLILFNMVTQSLDLPEALSYWLTKMSSILIICAISGIVLKLISLAQELLLHYYSQESRGKIAERKIYTQTVLLKRVAYALVSILTSGAILVLFDNVRTLGASVLTTAGIMGLVFSFAAQRSLVSLFSGLEIALTQPIKIGDKVLIENEYGTIEEINFRNVVVKLWNWRHLIVPTHFFLEKSFQNWSRVEDTNLIGTVFLYLDFTLPVPILRSQLNLILGQTDLWDGNVNKLLVNEWKGDKVLIFI